MSEFRIDDYVYKTSRMSGVNQVHILAKLSPLVAGGAAELLPLIKNLRTTSVPEETGIVDRLTTLLPPVARELSRLSDEDREFVINHCMSIVERKRDGEQGWFKIWNFQANRSMFTEIDGDATVILRVVVHVLFEVLSPFFSGSLFGSSGAAKS